MRNRRHHLITFAILLAAVALYYIGFTQSALLVIVAAMVVELVFWIRLLKPNGKKTS